MGHMNYEDLSKQTLIRFLDSAVKRKAELEQQVEELKKENVRLSNLIRYSRE